MTDKSKGHTRGKVILVGGVNSNFRRLLDETYGEENVVAHQTGKLIWEAIDVVRATHTGKLHYVPYNLNGGQRFYEVSQRGDLRQGPVDLDVLIEVNMDFTEFYRGKGRGK